MCSGVWPTAGELHEGVAYNIKLLLTIESTSSELPCTSSLASLSCGVLLLACYRISGIS